MKDLSSDSCDSILRDTVEGVKQFSWETVKIELNRNVPTLMSLLSQLIPTPENRTPLICMIASQLLKCRHQRLCLVQRAVSIMLYGNGTSKQVSYYNYINGIFSMDTCNFSFAPIGLFQSATPEHMPIPQGYNEYCTEH